MAASAGMLGSVSVLEAAGSAAAEVGACSAQSSARGRICGEEDGEAPRCRFAAVVTGNDLGTALGLGTALALSSASSAAFSAAASPADCSDRFPSDRRADPASASGPISVPPSPSLASVPAVPYGTRVRLSTHLFSSGRAEPSPPGRLAPARSAGGLSMLGRECGRR